jgi:DNA-binding beta-propeller fold protein YncE
LYRGRAPRVLLACLPLVLALATDGCSGCSKTRAPAATKGPATPGAAIPTPPAGAAYVTNNGSDSISVLSRDGDTVTTVPVDLDPDAHEAPHHLAVDARGQRVFVALAFPPEAKGTPSAKDPHAGHGAGSEVGKLVRLDLGTLAVREARDVDENPGDVVLTHDARRVLVTHFDMRRAMDVAAKGGASPSTMFAQLLVFDADTMTRLGARPICVAPHGITVTADDRTAYVACYGSDELAIVDLSGAGLPTSRIPVGGAPGVPGVPRFGPYSATLSPDERLVVVADLESRDLRVLDRASRRFQPERTVVLDARALMPAFVDDHTVLVPTQSPDGLARVDLTSARVERRTSFPKDQCALPHAARRAKDGRLYLVCEGDHHGPGSVLEIDPDALSVRRAWRVGTTPDGVAFGDD